MLVDDAIEEAGLIRPLEVSDEVDSGPVVLILMIELFVHKLDVGLVSDGVTFTLFCLSLSKLIVGCVLINLFLSFLKNSSSSRLNTSMVAIVRSGERSLVDCDGALDELGD